MGITYNAGTKTITVTGYTEAMPCTFLDIYNADVAGAWGVVAKQCDVQFCFDAALKFGDGSTATWFKDTSKHVVYNSGIFSAHYNALNKIYNNAHFQLGELENVTSKITSRGCALHDIDATYATHLIYGYAGSEVFLYSSDFLDDRYDGNVASLGLLKIYNCLMSNNISVASWNANNDIDNLIIQSTGVGSGIVNCLGIVKNIYLSGFVKPFMFANSSADFTIANLKIYDSTYAGGFWNYSGTATVINAESSTWALHWHNSASATLYRKYELDLKVIDKDNNALSGVAVKIWDKDDNLVVNVTTGAGGKIATQTLNYGYYTQAGGDTPTMQTPHTIEISKADYQIYKTKFTCDEKIAWRIRLLQANPIQFLCDDPILQLCPESQEGDRILFVPV